MSRKIYVTSAVATDEKLFEVAQIDGLVELLWPRILLCLDDWGRMEANPVRIKLEQFPGNEMITPETIKTALEVFVEKGLLISYQADGKCYVSADPATWFRIQTHVRKEKRKDDSASHCPAPPGWSEWVKSQDERESEDGASERKSDREAA